MMNHTRNYQGYSSPWVPPPSWAVPPLTPYMGSIIPKQHKRFFFADGNVAFQLRDTVYKVHRYFFTENSESIAALIPTFNTPAPECTPIYLPDVEPRGFELILSIFYPKDYLRCEAETVDDWGAILAAATKYQMKKIRALAIDKLGSIASAVDKVELGKEYGVKEWLVPAYTELCMRFEPLTLNESKKLGLETVVKIAEMKYEIMENLKKFVDDGKVGKIFEDKFN